MFGFLNDDAGGGKLMLYALKNYARGSRLKEKSKLDNTNATDQLIFGKAGF